MVWIYNEKHHILSIILFYKMFTNGESMWPHLLRL